MIETNPYINSIIDKSLNIYKVGLSYKLDDLDEEMIDEINLLIMKDLEKLDPSKKTLTIELLTEFPITIWIYIISISKYIKGDLIIMTMEDINQIKSLIDIPNNLILTSSNI